MAYDTEHRSTLPFTTTNTLPEPNVKHLWQQREVLATQTLLDFAKGTSEPSSEEMFTPDPKTRRFTLPTPQNMYNQGSTPLPRLSIPTDDEPRWVIREPARRHSADSWMKHVPPSTDTISTLHTTNSTEQCILSNPHSSKLLHHEIVDIANVIHHLKSDPPAPAHCSNPPTLPSLSSLLKKRPRVSGEDSPHSPPSPPLSIASPSPNYANIISPHHPMQMNSMPNYQHQQQMPSHMVHQHHHHHQPQQPQQQQQMNHTMPPSASNMNKQSGTLLMKLKPKKRRRRRDEIERKYACPVSQCNKSYGTEGALKTHIKLKHPEDPIVNQMQSVDFVWPAHVFLGQDDSNQSPTNSESKPGSPSSSDIPDSPEAAVTDE